MLHPQGPSARAGRKRPVPTTAAAGFTLLEVMMAVAIIAMMSGLVWSSFGRLLSVSRSIELQDTYWHGVRVAMTRLTRECSMAFISNNFDKNRYRSDDPSGRPTFFVIEDGGERDRLSFTAFVHHRLYQDEKASDQAIVDYTLEPLAEEDLNDHEGTSGASRNVEGLYRREKTIIDEDWDREGVKYLLLAGVTAFNVEWWDPDEERWNTRWSTRDTDQHNQIPSRLRITLKATDPNGVEKSFTTQTRVALTTPLSW